jgi:hypothetical protein
MFEYRATKLIQLTQQAKVDYEINPNGLTKERYRELLMEHLVHDDTLNREVNHKGTVDTTVMDPVMRTYSQSKPLN